MLDKIGVAFILAILFLVYAVADPAGAAEALIGALAGVALGYLFIAFLQWRSHRLGN
jgi:membrane associated rhomboid family serine protease